MSELREPPDSAPSELDRPRPSARAGTLASPSWSAWCGQSPDALLVAGGDVPAFLQRTLVESARTIWLEKHANVDGPARLALARLIARRVGRSDAERDALATALVHVAHHGEDALRSRPPPPEPAQVASVLERLPRREWRAFIDGLRFTFFPELSLESLLVELVRELSRGRAR